MAVEVKQNPPSHAKKKTIESISTGCGPSDDEEIVSNSIEVVESAVEEEINEIDLEFQPPVVKEENHIVPVTKISTSVGTSPPPQCAGTQVRIICFIY